MEPALTPAPTWPGTSRRPKATRPERHTGNTGACRKRCETRSLDAREISSTARRARRACHTSQAVVEPVDKLYEAQNASSEAERVQNRK